MPAPETIVGIISDTHGLLRPEAIAALRGSHLIIHAGDVGSPEIIDELNAIAPTFTVRGNIDRGSWAARLPMTELVDAGGRTFFVLHDIAELDPPTAGFAAIVYGHSHAPKIETRDGVLYLNPGSAGPRRFRLPTSVAKLSEVNGRLSAEIIEIAAAGAR
jgi:uncharacterized protein